ncbi:hypothetical protein JW978_04585 [Candidatus Dojkabacteria bacterium]|nr:hypothetical protein [Candidatus Dojkabacteria bacterium]
MRTKLFLLTVLSLIALSALMTRPSSAQNLSDCYVRKIANPDIVCSLCGTEFKEVADDCDADGQTYDQALCRCMNNSLIDNCDTTFEGSKERIASARNLCYRDGYFWIESYCVCDRNITVGVVTGIDESAEDFKDTVFFDTNFDGSIDNLAELIRMAFILAFAAIAVISAFIGFYGMGLYSTAGENDEQVKKAQGVLKSGLIGVAVAVLGVFIIQFVAVAVGVADSVTDTSFEISAPADE